MTRHSPYPQAVRDYLRRLGNPYAFLEYEAGAEETRGEAAAAPTTYLKPYVRHPYANIQADAEAPGSSPNVAVGSPLTSATGQPAARAAIRAPRATKADVSQAAFRRQSRAVFRRYIPKAEAGKLRPHHRDFIERNVGRPPQQRQRLLDELRRYDLASIPGLTAHFNREREIFTESKLAQIERLVDSQD